MLLVFVSFRFGERFALPLVLLLPGLRGIEAAMDVADAPRRGPCQLVRIEVLVPLRVHAPRVREQTDLVGVATFPFGEEPALVRPCFLPLFRLLLLRMVRGKKVEYVSILERHRIARSRHGVRESARV